MQLNDEAIKEFQEIWKKEYGEDITWEKARDEAENLLSLFQIVYGSK